MIVICFVSEMMEPGQDLLLAALSESGISPNDLFDIDSTDMGLATTAPAVQQVGKLFLKSKFVVY